MAFTTDQLNALETAIAQGATSVRLNGREIRYHSLGDMIRLRDTMRAELGVAVSDRSKSRLFSVTAGKGL